MQYRQPYSTSFVNHMLKSGFIFFFIFFCGQIFAQTLVFLHTQSGKKIELEIGQTLSVQYRGYMGQVYTEKNVLTEINDSMITIGYPPETGNAFFNKALEQSGQVYRHIFIRDIVAFRRITLARTLIKQTLTLGAFVGSYFLLSEVYSNKNLSNLQAFGISLGVGIGTSLLIQALFPESPKYKMSQGWTAGVH